MYGWRDASGLVGASGPVSTSGRVGLGLCIALLAGCTTLIIETDWDEDTDFSKLQSWAWMPGTGPRGDLGSVDPARLDELLRAAVERELATKGYTLQRIGTPDFLVGYHAAVTQEEDVRAMNEYYGYAGGLGYGPGGVRTQRVVEQYDQGTPVIDVSTGAGSRLVWRGSAQARVLESATPDQRAERLDDAVAQILGSFPPS